MRQPGPVRQAVSLFRDRFGTGPVLCASAPGRVNLIGEHTDYNGGPVLPFAIDRRTAVAGSEDEGWTVVSQVDGTMRAIDPDHPEPDSWTAYVGGVIRVLQARELAPPGARLAVASSVPIGAGLSSSAALTVATARVLVGLTGRRLPPPRSRTSPTGRNTMRSACAAAGWIRSSPPRPGPGTRCSSRRPAVRSPTSPSTIRCGCSTPGSGTAWPTGSTIGGGRNARSRFGWRESRAMARIILVGSP